MKFLESTQVKSIGNFDGFLDLSAAEKAEIAYVEPNILINSLKTAFNLDLSGSSSLAFVTNRDSAWRIGFTGIPRYAVMLAVLAIMENNILPNIAQPVFEIVFNNGKDDELTLTSITPSFFPNGNTYLDVLQFVLRCQHRCY